MKCRTAIALAAVLLAGCSAAGGARPSTERFQQPSPEPASEWIAVRTMWQDQSPAIEFRHPATGDVLVSTMLAAMAGFPAAEYRQALDTKLSAGCSGWTSRTLDDTPAGAYPRQIWYTRCDKGRTSTAFLHFYVTGRHAGYYVFYRWNGTPDTRALEKWTKYMREL